MLFARPAPVAGRLIARGDLLLATLDSRTPGKRTGESERVGIGAFDRGTGEEAWSRLGIPPLATADGEGAYAYARTGVVLALDGSERWLVSVPDDRSPAGIERGDAEAPLPADAVATADGVAVSAGAELVKLARSSGGVIRRALVCSGERAAVARVARSPGGFVCTCTARSDWDDELRVDERHLWEPPTSLEERRTAPGDVVALGSELEERWRARPPLESLAYGDRSPACAPDGTVLVTAATIGEGQWLSVFHDRLLAFDGATGELRWERELPGGRGAFDPVVTEAGVLVGSEPALYSVEDGTRRWRLPAGRPPLETTVAPALDRDRLLFAGRGIIWAVQLADGEPLAVARFAQEPFAGEVTTRALELAEDVVYLGVRERGRPTELRAVSVPR